MNNLKLFVSSIIFSIVIHLSVVLFFNSEKKDNEIYVVNLSEFREFSISTPTISKPKLDKKVKNEEVKKKLLKKQEPPKKILKKKDTISVNEKIEKKVLVKTEKKEIKQEIKEIKQEKKENRQEKQVKKTDNSVNEQLSTNEIKPNQSLKKSNKIKVEKIISDYLTFVSLEINKMASKSYPIQSIKRREQGSFTSVLIIDKDGNLVDVEIKNKAPTRLYKSTIKILKKFNFPKPPNEILNSRGHLKITIPVNYILK